LVAGLVGKYRASHKPGAEKTVVALGPFLAIGGLAAVIARAF
jgi:hypothetical protein